ncbi:Peptidase family M50 [Candidatus Norongarragalina meridionalis]|nr:Peptidase family M50 [Candidatus Norongarragalina meridionalis]
MRKDVLVLVTALVFGALFFLFAFSDLDNLVKAVALLSDLFLCGVILKRLTGVEGYYGLIIVRGLAGFRAMRYIADHYAETCRKIADAGLSIGFGAFYAYYVFGKKKILWHLAAIGLFFAFFWFIQNTAGFAVMTSALFFAVGIALGLFGLGLMFIMQHAYNVLTVSGTPPGITLLIPGVTVPWETLPAIIIIATVHEIAHGVMCNIERIKLKSSGAMLFGFLPIGAFVEPDEASMKRAAIHKRRRVLVAGSTSNILFFFVFLGLTLGATAILQTTVQAVEVDNASYGTLTHGERVLTMNGAPVKMAKDLDAPLYSGVLMANLTTSLGEKSVMLGYVEVSSVTKGRPAYGVLQKGDLIYSINGITVDSLKTMEDASAGKKAGDSVVLGTDRGTMRVPYDENGKMGVELTAKKAVNFKDVPTNDAAYALMTLIVAVLGFTYVLNFLLALFNLLPLFITDGHQIVLGDAVARFGEKKGRRIALAIALGTLLILAINGLPWFIH